MEAPPAVNRIVSLDQFRGYTVLGMFFVNFVGGYAALREYAPVFLHHHTYCSYADTIMPQFFFAVGFAYRLTILRGLACAGRWATLRRVVKRSLGLMLLGFVIYHLDGGAKTWSELSELGVAGFFRTAFQRNFFQTLVHIGVTSLWVLPVIAGGPWVRIGWMMVSAGLHVWLSYAFYYDWVMTRPGIDGGPLGFLTWTIPLLVGSLAYDMMRQGNEPKPAGQAARTLALTGLAVALLGYLLACLNLVVPPVTTYELKKQAEWESQPRAAIGGLESPALVLPLVEPPFVPPSRPVTYWTMSQRAGSVPYLVFGAGFSLLVFAVFVWLCDGLGWHFGLFRTLGVNALAGYIIHELVADAVNPWTPKDAPLGYVLVMFVLFFGICLLFLRFLEKHRLFLRL